MPDPQPIVGLAAIADRYDALLCDVWGVVHDGKTAFPKACDALIRFRETRGPVLLLSNASRPGPPLMAMLDTLGVPRAAYDGIESSGDATRQALAARPGVRLFHLGPERGREIFAGLAVYETALQDADLVLCSGLVDDDTEGPDNYRALLTTARAWGLPMLCANPDLQASRGPRLVWCAGALAAAYEALGGAVTYLGKPHRPIYDASLRRLDTLFGRPLDPARILAIGHGLRTDLAGANRMGLDALLITAGIHAAQFGPGPEAPDAVKVYATLAADGLHAVAFMPRLAW